MYRLFIADDNELARQALKRSVQWAELNCEFCGEASNGTEALAFIAEKKPDIVLMDIKMPGISGMDVIAALREQGVDSLFIMVTAYDDFTFMRQGMQMGVFDYILKPVADKELHTVLFKAVESLAEHEEEKQIAQNYKEKSESYAAQLKEVNEELEEKLFIDAVNGSKDSSERFAKILKAKYRIHDYFLMLVVPEEEREGGQSIDEFIDRQCSIMAECSRIYHAHAKGIWIKEGYLMLLSFARTMFLKEYDLQSLRMAEFICRKNEEASVGVYMTISHVSSSFEELSDLFGQVLFCKNSRFFLENQKIIHYDSLRSRRISGEYLKMRKLEELYAACREHRASVRDCMADFLNQFSVNEIYDIDYVKNILIQAAIMMVYIQREAGAEENDFPDVNDVVKELSEMHSLQNAFQWMQDFADRVEMSGDIRRKISQQTKKILDYLNEHYTEQISLQDVADYMGVSGTHVSRLIKNDIGETFITLLNKIRIKESIRLLRSGGYKVYEIAEMVGYSNYAYFYQIFKKHTGVSPKDYV